MNKKGRPEVLAPAGAWEQLTAAAACGADAVYLGAQSLNARRGAGNFDGEQLARAVEYCHVRGIRVHLAMNTLVLEPELEEAVELARTACALGVDGVIVQDLGLAALLRRSAPDLRLHGSTQMAVHNLSGAKQLEELGFARVVLAREMGREEIARVAAGTSLETEVFVHGAQCMCVSGQCYMSSVIGQRSGNRGLCAQPCRLPFYLAEKGRYDLSLKDLSLVERLGELAELGVDSLKIEGRMKRPEYVAAAVTACRKALRGEQPDLEALQAVFSRSGFTDGYYESRRDSAMFGTRQKEDVVSAAGVLGELAQLYRKETPRVALKGSFVLRRGTPAALTLEDGEGNRAQARGEAPEEARSKPTTPEMLRQSLEKLGGTPYRLEELKLDWEDGLALPVSKVNVLRRQAVEELTAQRGRAGPIPFEPALLPPWVLPERSPAPPSLWGRFARAEQIPPGIQGLERVILPPEEAAKVDAAWADKLCVELPRIQFDDYEGLRPLLEGLRRKGVGKAMAGNLGALWLAKRLGFEVTADWAMNLMNSQALAHCRDLGCAGAVLSFECGLREGARLARQAPCGLLAYGYLPLMIVRNCPARLEQSCAQCTGVTKMYDRLGNGFPVGCGGGRQVTEIYNHLPLYLADRLGELRDFAFLTLYFTIETKEECAAVIREYQTGGKREGVTRGLYYRNLL